MRRGLAYPEVRLEPSSDARRPAHPEASHASRPRPGAHVARPCSELPDPVFQSANRGSRSRADDARLRRALRHVLVVLPAPPPVMLWPTEADLHVTVVARRSERRVRRHCAPGASEEASGSRGAAPRRAARRTEVRQEPEQCRRTAADRSQRCRSRDCRSSRGVEPRHRLQPHTLPRGTISRALPRAFPYRALLRRRVRIATPPLPAGPRPILPWALFPSEIRNRRRDPGFPGDAVDGHAAAQSADSDLRPRAGAAMVRVAVPPVQSSPEGSARAGAFRRSPWGL